MWIAQVGTVDTLAEILAIGNTTGGTDIVASTTDKVQFRDAAIYINSSVDGQLDIVADTEIQIAATTVDLNGALDVSGTALVTGVLTTTAATVSNGGGQFNGAINVGVDDTGYDVKFFGATAGAYMLWDEKFLARLWRLLGLPCCLQLPLQVILTQAYSSQRQTRLRLLKAVQKQLGLIRVGDC
jgi:hypothetical protein